MERMSPSMRSTATMMLKRLSKSYLQSADALQLYTTAFDQGWIGYNTLKLASVDNLTAYQKHGKRYLVGDFYYTNTKENETQKRIGFEFEDNTWKIDLVPIFIAIDYDIKQMLLVKGADPSQVFEATLEDSENSAKPENWKIHTYKDDEFAIRFPRDPLFVDNAGERIYTSKDYRYGQFDVRVRYYDANSTMTAFHLKS